MMNKWTVALAATGVVSLASAVLAEESHPLNTLLPSTTLSGYVDTSAIDNLGTGNAQAARFANTASDRQDGFNLNVVKVALEEAPRRRHLVRRLQGRALGRPRCRRPPRQQLRQQPRPEAGLRRAPRPGRQRHRLQDRSV
jgi:hypothetical protein